MGFLNRRVRRRNSFRRFTHAMLLIAYLITAVGVPLPAGTLPAQGSELYPCADHECGCRSADQCWRACCCHSLAERFAWAREHRVRPPDFAIAEARRSGIDLAWLGEKNSRELCSHSKLNCTQKLVAARSKCCQAKGIACESGRRHSRCCTAKVSEQHEDSTPNTAMRVVGWKALECQGQSSIWLTAVPTLIGLRAEVASQLPQISRLGPPISDVAMGVADAPTPPPPERV